MSISAVRSEKVVHCMIENDSMDLKMKDEGL